MCTGVTHELASKAKSREKEEKATRKEMTRYSGPSGIPPKQSDQCQLHKRIFKVGGIHNNAKRIFKAGGIHNKAKRIET